MIYEYHCKACQDVVEVIKSYKQIDDLEKCPDCDGPMERLFSFGGQISAKPFEEGYNPAFGKVFTTKRQLKEELARYRDRGIELVETGNERPKIKPKEFVPDVEGATRELNYRLKHGHR